MSDVQKEYYFVDRDGEPLFKVREGESFVLRYINGTEEIKEFHWTSSQNPEPGSEWNARRLAKECSREGTVYRPLHPKEGDIFDTYEIYQIPYEKNVPYKFMGYEYGKNYLKAADYQLKYRGMLAPHVRLENLFALHNSNSRPFGTQMHSLSMSDVLVTRRSGMTKAWYVDTVGFRELPGFADQLEKKSMPYRSHEPSDEHEWNEAVYDKLRVEQEDYREWLLTQPPEEILNHAYEYSIREDLLLVMETDTLTEEQARAVLKVKKPLAKLAQKAIDYPGEHMEEMRFCIEQFADEALEQRRSQKRCKSEKREKGRGER